MPHSRPGSIARIYRDENSPEKAKKYALAAVYIDPYDDSAHELLAEICEKAKDDAGLAREKNVLTMLEEWKKIQEQKRENQQ